MSTVQLFVAIVGLVLWLLWPFAWWWAHRCGQFDAVENEDEQLEPHVDSSSQTSTQLPTSPIFPLQLPSLVEEPVSDTEEDEDIDATPNNILPLNNSLDKWHEDHH